MGEPNSIAAAIRRGLQSEIDRIAAEEVEAAIKTANENVSRRVREMATNVAANVLQQFNMQCRGQELIIRVDFSNDRDS